MGGFGQHVRWMALLDNRFQIGDLKSTADKVEYILETVYNGRTASTWINYEETFSPGLNDQIYFNHQLDKENRIVRLKNQHNQRFFKYTDDTRILSCTCDSKIALRWYRAINPDLNQWTKTQFLERAEIDNMLALAMPTHCVNTLIINNDILHYSNLLNTHYYRKLTSHLQLDDNYIGASEIHRKWWELHHAAQENNSA